jgi:twitching motility protein PilT
MNTLDELLMKATTEFASDLHITVGLPPMIRVYGRLIPCNKEALTKKDTEYYAKQILSEEQYERYSKVGEIDLSYAKPGISRFRVNIFKQRGSDAMALRTIPFEVPTLDSLGMPLILKELTNKMNGLIIVTGPTGSGKSTTLAAMIDEMNRKRNEHIITLEEPIEYLHKHKKCIVNQREIGSDSMSYANALRAVLREDPDVILVGEMRDLETIAIALTAAETGHLVLSTLHTIGASKTIDRIVDVFPSHQQQQIKVQLAGVIEGVISQQLLENINLDGRVCAMEIMISTPAIKNLIREGKTHLIDSAVQTGMKYGMKSMDMALTDLYKQGRVGYEEMLKHCVDREMIGKYMTS